MQNHTPPLELSALVIGTGYLGSALAQSMLSTNYKVYGVTRESTPQPLISAGGISIKADLKNSDSLADLPDTHYIFTCAAPGKNQKYSDIYVDGTRNVIKELKRRSYSKLRKSVLVSSTGIWGNHFGQWVDEKTPPSYSDEKSSVLTEYEKLWLSSGLPVTVARLAGIYGPERHRIFKISEHIQNHVSQSDRYVNLIHRDDAISALLILLEKGKCGEVYCVCDDHPALESERNEWIAEQLGYSNTQKVCQTRGLAQGKRCSNAKLRNLGWRPLYPSYCEGYLKLLSDKKS